MALVGRWWVFVMGLLHLGGCATASKLLVVSLLDVAVGMLPFAFIYFLFRCHVGLGTVPAASSCVLSDV
ncbi:hypothetical protein, partial [Escherichia coli]|uniref:hypothetical protein n=1 Tax=Escherichia coli TaxID=562 RepID=UPI00292D8404